MNSYTRYLDGKQFDILIRGHHILSDQTPESGGADAGVSPPELLLAALGSCAAYYAVEYLHARNLGAAGLHVHVTAEKAFAPTRLDSFRIGVVAPGLPAQYRQGLVRAVRSCLIHNTLTTAPSVEIAIETETQTVVPAAEMALTTT
jgi:uncharacterized OsmC-like protein